MAFTFKPYGPGRWNRRGGIRDVMPVPWPFSPLVLSDGPHIEMELNGPGSGWIDVSRDTYEHVPITVEYGIRGTGPFDLVSETGRLSFALNNKPSNSAEAAGFYSPENPLCRPGFRLGIGVRFSWWLSGTGYYKFTGWIDTIDPVAGQYLDRITFVTAVDWMDEAARMKPTVATQVNRRSDQVLQSVVEVVPRQPKRIVFDVGDTTFPYALDNSESDRQPVLTECQRIAQSEYSRIVIRGNTIEGGELRFFNRSATVSPMTLATFSDDMSRLAVPQQRKDIINTCRAITHPRRVDTAATSVLFTLQGTPSVAAGQTLSINGRYNDPADRASRVGGMDMQTPTPTTDYTMNANSDGSGADLTANFTVTAIYGANSLEYTIVNNGATAGFITKLEARGRGLYDYDPVETPVSSASSIASHGENEVSINMPYQTDPNVAFAVAEYVVGAWSSPASTGAMLGFLATGDDVMMLRALSLEPGDAIGIFETLTGVTQAYVIHGVSLRVEMGNILSCDWLLQRAQIADYWLLGVAGRSELEQTTVVGPL